MYIYNIYKSTDEPQHACIRALKSCKFPSWRTGRRVTRPVFRNPPKITGRGRRNIVLGSFVCDARHDLFACILYTYIQLSPGLSAPHTPYASRFIKDPAKFSLSFFFHFYFTIICLTSPRPCCCTRGDVMPY